MHITSIAFRAKEMVPLTDHSIVYTMGLRHFRRFSCLQKCNSTHFICHPCAQKLENYYVCQILSAFKSLPKNSSLPEFASEILLRLYLFFNLLFSNHIFSLNPYVKIFLICLCIHFLICWLVPKLAGISKNESLSNIVQW